MGTVGRRLGDPQLERTPTAEREGQGCVHPLAWSQLWMLEGSMMGANAYATHMQRIVRSHRALDMTHTDIHTNKQSTYGSEDHHPTVSAAREPQDDNQNLTIARPK